MQILYVWATSFSVPCITKTLRQYCLFLDWAGSTSSLVDFDWSGNGPSSGKHRNLGRAYWILSFSPPLQWNISILTVKKLNVVVKVIFDNVRAVFSFRLSPGLCTHTLSSTKGVTRHYLLGCLNHLFDLSSYLCLLPELFTCGKTDNPLRLAVSSDVGLWPWIATLGFRTKRWNHQCGASLLSSTVLITAAHCAREVKKGTVEWV